MDPTTGLIYRVRQVDHEALRGEASSSGSASTTFRLSVEAAQKDNPLKTASASVEVEVLDANDNAPVFDVDSVDVAVRENSPGGTRVARLRARDPDTVSPFLQAVSASVADFFLRNYYCAPKCKLSIMNDRVSQQKWSFFGIGRRRHLSYIDTFCVTHCIDSFTCRL